MIRMTVTYPSADGATFDHDYYEATHVPMCEAAWSPAKVEIDKGVNGPSVAAVHLFFDSMDAYQAALASPKTPEILADVPNYTSIRPVIQVSEVVR